MVLVDLSNIFYRCLFFLESQQKKDNVDNIVIDKDMLLKAILKELRYREDQFSLDYGRLILCVDSNKNWRNDYFKQYKLLRKENREKDDKDWTYLFSLFDSIIDDLKNNTSYVVIRVDKLEADDIIALCCQKSNEKIVIVSLDKDLNQLIDNKRIKQYSPRDNDFIKEPKITLNEAILTGDSSDGVPNIFSEDDHYTSNNNVRAKPVTKKVKEYFANLNEIKEDNIINFVTYYNNNVKKDEDKLNTQNIINHFNRNKRMIDLHMIPEEYLPIFKENLKQAIQIANNNKLNHNIWCDNIINDSQQNDINNKQDEIDIGDLFD